MQLGIMYLLVFCVYFYLMVLEFLLFIVFIFLYIILIYDLFSGCKLCWGYLLSVVLVVLGVVIICYDKVSDYFWIGLLLVQLLNFCFVIGMVGYKCLMEVCLMLQYNVFVWFYVGVFIVVVVVWFMFGNVQKLLIIMLQWSVLVWFGVVVFGLGYFMWNYGVIQVDVGMLGIMNNVYVFVGLLVNFVIWQEQLYWLSFISGVLVILVLLWVYCCWVVLYFG